METVLITAQDLAQGVWDLTLQNPVLLTPGEITQDCLLYEAAAQNFLLDFCERRAVDLQDLPKPVKMLVKAFIANFLNMLLQDQQLKTQMFQVPKDADKSDQARFAIAQMLREQIGQNAPPN